MKYAAVVLFNNKNPLSMVDFQPVTDALLAGGVFLDEIACCPYDGDFGAALSRLSLDCEGIFVIADGALHGAAREEISACAGELFEEETVLETSRTLFVVLRAGTKGAETVRCDILPRIDARRKNCYRRVVLSTVTAPAETVRSVLEEARAAADGKLVLHASEKHGVCRIELIYDRETPKMIADEVARILAVGLNDFLCSLSGETVAERLVETLKIRRLRISTAESLTGGGVGRAIVRVAGASEVFFEGINAYDERAKTLRLGVQEKTLKEHGAVSADTAYEMAAGLIRGGNCDIAVATTGAAGPTSPQEGVPVGLVYIAVGTREQVNVFRFHLTGTREEITETAINYALFLAYKQAKGST